MTQTNIGKARKVKSCVGVLKLKAKQAQRIGLKPRSQLSPCMYYGAFFGDNQSLIDYVNSQPLTNPLVCLGDGHDGVWNLVKEFATSSSRWEILDWYHLKENLYKVGGSLKRLKQAEALLWAGQVEVVRTLFSHCRLKQAKNFCAYLEQHRQRIVNYSYYQSEQLCSVG